MRKVTDIVGWVIYALVAALIIAALAKLIVVIVSL